LLKKRNRIELGLSKNKIIGAESVDMAPELPAALYFFSKKFEFKDSKKYERNTGTWRIICNTRMLKVM
jgi:hypothetical protein